MNIEQLEKVLMDMPIKVAMFKITSIPEHTKKYFKSSRWDDADKSEDPQVGDELLFTPASDYLLHLRTKTDWTIVTFPPESLEFVEYREYSIKELEGEM